MGLKTILMTTSLNFKEAQADLETRFVVLDKNGYR